MAKSETRVIGLDPGTAFFQTAEALEGDKIMFKTIRNVFVQLQETDDIDDVLKQNKWHHIKDDHDYYIIGEDALRVAKMFPGKVEMRRPMQDGVLNKNEEKKILVMNELIKSSIGDIKGSKSLVCFCVSSPSVDGSMDSEFHKGRLTGMIKALGCDVKVIEEGFAVCLAERPTIMDSDGKEAPYSGISCSCGAGRTNIVLTYKGVQILGMSVKMGGDYIDKKVSEQLDIPLSQIISKKEKELNFNNLNENDEVLFAYSIYYENYLQNVFNIFAKKFMEVKSQFESPLDIIFAGGTACVPGFDKKAEKVIKELKLPFQIKDVKVSKDPRNSVVTGCLKSALLYQRKINKSDSDISNILG